MFRATTAVKALVLAGTSRPSSAWAHIWATWYIWGSHRPRMVTSKQKATPYVRIRLPRKSSRKMQNHCRMKQAWGAG